MQRIADLGLMGVHKPRTLSLREALAIAGAPSTRRAAVAKLKHPVHDECEFRSLKAGGFEYRAEGESLVLRGYASTFQPYEILGGPDKGGWIEQLDRRAFDATLAAGPDLHLLVNHEGLPLARTKSGTLKLSTDNHGLKVWATLDRRDPDVQKIEPKMRRGDLNEMSCAFRVRRQEWTENDTKLRLLEVDLSHGDVSIVNFGANPTTSAKLVA